MSDNWRGTLRGSTADHCSTWPGMPHTMVTHMPAHTTVSVRRCSSCGWIDGADLNLQVAAAEARGRAEGRQQMIDALRDDERYLNWWSKLTPPDHPDYRYWTVGRQQLADYLESISTTPLTEKTAPDAPTD